MYSVKVTAQENRDKIRVRAVFEQHPGKKTERLEFEGESRQLLNAVRMGSHEQIMAEVIQFVLVLMQTRQELLPGVSPE